MLEKPDLAEEVIAECLQQGYGLPVAEVEFLPLGNDSSAWVYRVCTPGGDRCFLKVRRGEVYAPGVVIPRYLRDAGIEQVVAPLVTLSGDLWLTVDPFALILYPFIDGRTGMEVGLSESQWVEFGEAVSKIHATRLPADLEHLVRRETFALNPKWLGIARVLEDRVNAGRFQNAYEEALAAFWRERHVDIRRLLNRATALGRMARAEALDFVLCHADIHTANLLVTPDQSLFIVDWDDPILAPRERDLMFVVGDDQVNTGEIDLFLAGYGETTINPLALAYYRYEWVVQEIGDFGERVFMMGDVGDETRADSVRGFRQLFDPGDVVEAAYQCETHLPPGFRAV